MLGNVEAEKDEIRVIGNKFFSLLYSSSVPMAINKLCYKLFSTSRSTPDIRSLPPLFQHILRSHYQVLIWKSVLLKGPPVENATDWGWEIKNGLLEPVIGAYEIAPADVLKVVACGCESEKSCFRRNCSYNASGILCTTFCKCNGDTNCNNFFTKTQRYN